MIDKGKEVTKDKETKKRTKIEKGTVGSEEAKIERGVEAKTEKSKSKSNKLKNRRSRKAKVPVPKKKKDLQKKKDKENWP